MNQSFIKKLHDILEVNIENEQFGVNELSEAAGVSRSQLHRKLKSIEAKSASRFIREYRLQKAMEMLQKNVATASEISYRVGFGSPTYFNTSFREFYGYPPGEVKFRKEAIQKENDSTEDLTVKNNTAPNHKKPIKRSFIAIATLLLALVAATAYYFYQNPNSSKISEISENKATETSIAILPFKNLSSNKENQYFADGIMEVILNHLTTIKELKVISRTSMERYRETTKTIPEIAKELGVSHILEGSVQKNGKEIKIIAQLIDAKNDKHLWSTDIKKEYKDIFELQSTIAKQISKELNTELSSSERSQIEKKPTNNLEAYSSYLKGLHFVRGGLATKSLKFFERAIELDPKFALAYSGLAEASIVLLYRGILSPNKDLKRVKGFAQKAIALDSNLGQPHAMLGLLIYRHEWNLKVAEKELLTALNIDPNNVINHLLYSKFLNYSGKFNEARKHINMSLQLDPLSYFAYNTSTDYYYFSGEYEKALEEIKKAYEIKSPDLGTNWTLFKIYIAQQKYDKAISELQKGKSINESTEIGATYTEFSITGVYKWLISRDSVKKNYNTPYFLAEKYAFIGEKEKALSLLEKSAELRISRMPEINRNPYFKNLRSEPRFKKIIKKMGLDAYLDAQ